MLVLSRKVDQEIVIDGNIKIHVLKIKGNTIRLGIEAPSEVHIARGELEKKDSRQARNIPKADDVSANFSLVFDENDVCDSAASSEPIPLLLPFDDSAEINRLKSVAAAKKVAGDGEEEFRGKLPGMFKRNRLQEIVDRMTSDN